jgi:hypothetical protein
MIGSLSINCSTLGAIVFSIHISHNIYLPIELSKNLANCILVSQYDREVIHTSSDINVIDLFSLVSSSIDRKLVIILSACLPYGFNLTVLDVDSHAELELLNTISNGLFIKP